MDIITSHRQGLIEQLEDDVQALAGLARDHCQRAIVLHHLFRHSREAHAWALGEALREMRIARGLAALGRRAQRLGWLMPRRDAAEQALDALRRALGELSRVRCANACRAYRLTAVNALEVESRALLPAALHEALSLCHDARRSGNALAPAARQSLHEATEDFAELGFQQGELIAAWAQIEAAPLGRMARRLVGRAALDRVSGRCGGRSWEKSEKALRADPLLPLSFRANPAQHYYSLQQTLAERRRRRWREACDREPGAFELAA